MTPETMALQLAEQDPYLQKESLLGENLEERLERFGVIVENAYGNWDLSDRDENALRTANAMLVKQKAELEAGRAALRERDAEHEIALKKAHSEGRAEALRQAAAGIDDYALQALRAADLRAAAVAKTLAGSLRALLEEAGK